MTEETTSAGDLIQAFYDARSGSDLTELRKFIAECVIWQESEVGSHMGRLDGVDAVLDMIARARAATGDSFTLRIAELVEVAGHCAAVIAWSAEKDSGTLHGRELAVFSVRDGQIRSAQFLPERITDDVAFWS